MEMNPQLLKMVSASLAEALKELPSVSSDKVYVCPELLQSLSLLDKSLNLLLDSAPSISKSNADAAAEVEENIQTVFETGCAMRESIIALMARLAVLVW